MISRIQWALRATFWTVVVLGGFAQASVLSAASTVVHFPFDEGAGSLASYGSDSGYLMGGAAWSPGQQGSALELDGTGYVEVMDPADGSLDFVNTFTIALWVRPDNLGGHQMLVSKDDAYELEFGKLGADVLNLRLNNFIEGTASTPIQEGIWQHIVVTWDGSMVRFYRDGQPDGFHPHNRALFANERNLGVGARPSVAANGGPVFQLEGAMDDVRIYEVALDDAGVASLYDETVGDLTPPTRFDRFPGTALTVPSTSPMGLYTNEAATCRYSQESPGMRFRDMPLEFSSLDGLLHRSTGQANGTVTRFYVRCRDSFGNINLEDYVVALVVGDVDLDTGLQAYWTFDDGAGCAATDGVGLHDGSLGSDCLGGSAPQWSDGVFGQGLSFDGNDEVRATNDGALRQPSAVTMSAWVRHDGINQWRSIVDVRDGGTDGYDLFLTDQSRLFMRVGHSTKATSTALVAGKWHHVAGVYDGTSLLLYVDGIPVASTTAIESIDVTADILIGQHFATTAFGFVGDIDEVVLYDRGLSRAEMFQLYLDTHP